MTKRTLGYLPAPATCGQPALPLAAFCAGDGRDGAVRVLGLVEERICRVVLRRAGTREGIVASHATAPRGALGHRSEPVRRMARGHPMLGKRRTTRRRRTTREQALAHE